MGMFDWLMINTDLLPVSDAEKRVIGDNPGWQTKDLDNAMFTANITDSKILTIERFDLDIVPKNERPYPQAKGLKGTIGMCKRVNETTVILDYNGILCFYSDVGNDWYEFHAHFKNGRMINIKRVEASF